MSTLRDIAEEEYKLEMTPMIDVTFLLLIFFLLTIKFKTLEGKLSAYLPKDVGVNTSEAEPKEKVEITIVVRRAGERRDPNDRSEAWAGRGRYQFVGRELEYAIGPRSTKDLAELARQLKTLRRQDPERPATIDCRAGTVYGDMVPVLDAAIDANYTDITFIGEYKQ